MPRDHLPSEWTWAEEPPPPRLPSPGPRPGDGRRPAVVLGLIGPTLDGGLDDARWSRWRPTVSLGQQEDLLIARLELLHQARYSRTAERLVEDLRQVSPETEVRLHPVEFDDPWDFEDVYSALLTFAEGYPFEPEREDYLVHITTGTHVAQICTFLLTEARHLPAKLLQTSPPHRGAPMGSYRIIDLDLSAYDRIATRFSRVKADGVALLKAGIPTRNRAFNALVEELAQVAVASKAPILLTGPTGAGKTVLARRLYELKRGQRQLTGPLVEQNCATLRGDTAMSALFGHVRGAYTGALKDREGLLLRANGGLLFLDEVGELGLDEQAMLLRAVEEKRFLPLGADGEVSSDFQLIAGTNRDLRAEVSAGRFREDLLARLDLWTFRLPGLAERPEDIEPNLDYELAAQGALQGRALSINREARERFLAFAQGGRWVGNFRELGAAVTRMTTLAPGGRVRVEEVEREMARLRAAWAQGPEPSVEAFPRARAAVGEAALDRFDLVQLEAVLDALAKTRSLSEAGRLLFAESRKARQQPNDADRLRKYLARFGLTYATARPAEGM